MISFNLSCENEHLFEAWFASSAAFDKLKGAGEVVCPECGSTKVEKALMAPSLSRKVGEEKRMTAAEERARVRKALQEVRTAVEESSDYVGEAFAEEARKMHYGEAGKRNIYGEADDAEAKELAEEGVPFAKIPWVEKDN